MTPLLAPEFVRELEALGRLLRTRTRSGGAGSRTARRRGRGMEFEEHRAYTAGDDVARLDWLAFARTGQPVSKEHRADEDSILRLLLDGSASLGFGSPTKLEMTTRVAASMAYLALAAGHRVQVVTASGGASSALPAHRGRPALGSVLDELSALEPFGKVLLADAIRRVLAIAERPGELVVLSDFFDEGEVLDSLTRARHAGHALTLVHVLAPGELEPALEGDVALVDAETGEAVDVSPESIAAYEKRLSALCDALSGFARKTGSHYVRASTAEPLLGVVRRVVAG